MDALQWEAGLHKLQENNIAPKMEWAGLPKLRRGGFAILNNWGMNAAQRLGGVGGHAGLCGFYHFQKLKKWNAKANAKNTMNAMEK